MSVNTEIFTLRQYGRALGTRELGTRLANSIKDRVAETDDALVVDFDGVEIASSPVLDEIACALRAALQDHPGHTVVLARMNRDIAETLVLVLDNREMALAALDKDGLKLLGGRQHLEETLAAAQELGSFTAAELAERLEVKLPNLHHRLTQLQAAGAVTRSESGHGRTLQFRVATPEQLIPA